MDFTLSNALELAAVSALVWDWTQTLKIARGEFDHSKMSQEMNPILGLHPSVAEVNRYFIAVIMLELFAYELLIHSEFDKIGLILALAVAGVEGWQVMANKKLGL